MTLHLPTLLGKAGGAGGAVVGFTVVAVVGSVGFTVVVSGFSVVVVVVLSVGFVLGSVVGSSVVGGKTGFGLGSTVLSSAGITL